MNEYVIYYTDKDYNGGFESTGIKGLKESLKWLHSIKAKDIEVYKKGKNFNNDNDDVTLTNYK